MFANTTLLARALFAGPRFATCSTAADELVIMLMYHAICDCRHILTNLAAGWRSALKPMS